MTKLKENLDKIRNPVGLLIILKQLVFDLFHSNKPAYII